MRFSQEFQAALWLFPTSAAPWHFITVPHETSAELRMLSSGMRNAFGSVRVTARVGKTEWKTSLFWDSKRDSFLLPVKAAVRTKERIASGEMVSVVLELDV